ncbi:MAG: tripartite tricarboxylate transporter substrate binding protein [Microbacteriaceae bacterium]
MRKKLSVTAALITAAMLAGCAGPAAGPSDEGSAWPSGPITLIVAFGPGGSTDQGARLVATALEKELGVPIIVENHEGGSGQVGYNKLINSKADGYTFATTSSSAILGPIDPSINAPYTREDFAPISRIVFDPSVLAVRADSPYKNLEDVLAAVKANPSKVRISQVGPSGSDALLTMQLEEETGGQFNKVSFPKGASTASTALLGGDIDVLIANVGDVVEFEKAGQMRTLAVAGKERSPFLKDVPTFREQGFEIDLGSDRGFAFPGGTPEEIVTAMSTAIGNVMKDPAFVSIMEAASLQTAYLDTTEFNKMWDDHTEMWTKYLPILQAANK